MKYLYCGHNFQIVERPCRDVRSSGVHYESSCRTFVRVKNDAPKTKMGKAVNVARFLKVEDTYKKDTVDEGRCPACRVAWRQGIRRVELIRRGLPGSI